MRKIIIAIVISAFLTGCEKEQLNNGHSGLLVVEGYLYAGRPVDSIRISQVVYFNNSDTVFHGVSDATVSIKANGTTYNLQPSLRQGYYNYSGNNLTISAGETYSLSITYNNQQITSQTTVPGNASGLKISENSLLVDTTQTMRELRDSSLLVRWSNPDRDYYFVILENRDSILTPIRASSASGGFGYGGYPGAGTGTINLARRFQTRPIQDSLYRISLFSTVGNYGHYEFKLYKVTKDYASLYQSSSQNTINLNEPFTNINNGLGIFTAFSACDSLSFVVKNKILNNK
jgi:Domain of unknown function (DUF4249)